jgi:hypothetical protein
MPAMNTPILGDGLAMATLLRAPGGRVTVSGSIDDDFLS